MPLGRRKDRDDIKDGEMTPMQELNRISYAVPPTLPPLPSSPPPPSSSLLQQAAYGSKSTVSTSSSSSSNARDNKGLLSASGEKKSSFSSDDEREEMGHRPIDTRSDSDSDDNSEGDSLKDEHGREMSPVAEVAAVVSNTDDPSIPCLTFRFWVMGLASILSLAFVNQ
ncbi:hypothetical protein BGZ47_010094, partial [Haplosporangium gracile]